MPVRKARKVTTLVTIPSGSRRKKAGVLPSSRSNGDQPALIPVASPLDPVARRDLFREISVNRHRTLGLVPERLYNPDELAGRRGLGVYARMLTDDQVKAALTLKQHAVLSPGWDVEPASDSPQDLEIAEFVKFCLEDLEGSLDDDLLETLSSLAFGFSIGELVYRPITNSRYQGKIGLRAIKTRLPHDFVFVVDSHDNLLEDGIEQFGRRMPTSKFIIHCLHGDTVIHSPEGDRPIKDLVDRQPWVYGWKDGRLRLGRARRVWQSKQNAPCVKVVYKWRTREQHRWVWKENSIICTDTHPFMLYDDSFRKAGQLRSGDRLRPLFQRQHRNGRWKVRVSDGEWPSIDVSRQRWVWEEFHGMPVPNGYDIHHADGDRGYDTPENLVAVLAGEHHREHSRQRWQNTTQKVRRAHSRRMLEARTRALLDPKKYRAMRAKQSVSAQARAGELTIRNRRRAEADGYRSVSVKMRAWWKTADRVEMGQRMHAAWTPERRAKLAETKRQWWAARKAEMANHQVVSVEPWGIANVYDMEVPGLGCFAANDVFVHNSANKTFDNFYGTSDLRAAYRSFWFKDNVLKWWAMFMDRYGIPLAEGIVPRGGALGDDAVTGLRTVLDSLQAATSIVHPDDITLQFPAIASATGSQIFAAAINAADQAIARALLLPNLLGVSAPADTGSFSQARKHFDVFILVVEKLQRDLANHVMGDQVIRRLVDLNYMVEDYPVFTFLPFTETDKGQLLSLWYQAIAAGAVQTRPEDEVHVRSITGFPEVPLEDLQAEADAAEAREQAGGGFPGGLGGDPGGQLGGEGGFPPGEGGSPGLGAPSEPGGGDLGDGGGEEPTDEELDALIDEVLGSSSAGPRSAVTGKVGGGGRAGHRLAERVRQALPKTFVAGVAQIEEDGFEEADEVSAILERLEADHPDWDDDALVEAAVAELSGGSDEEGDGDVTDADLDGLLDEVLGGQDQQADGGSAEEDAVAAPAVDEAELDRLIAAALAKRDGPDSAEGGEDGGAEKRGQAAKPFGAVVPLLKEGETLTSGPGGESGVWRMIGGNRVFIPVDVAGGESVPEAVRREVGKKGGISGVARGGKPTQAVSPDILTPGGTGAEPRDLGAVLAETPDAKTRKALVDADRSLSPEQKAALEDTELKHDSLPGEGAARWKLERRALHDRLLAGAEGTYQPSPERQAQRTAGMRPELILVMGGPGAGKTSALHEYVRVRSGDFLGVNADDFKLQLPEFGTVAGDDAVWKAASQTVHEESSYLSKALLARGFSRKADIIVDGTLANVDKAVALAATAKSLGYRVSLHYIDAPVEVGLARTKRRAESEDRTKRRYVPEGFVRESYGKIGASFERLRTDANVDSWTWYKVPTAVAGAERFARGSRELPTPRAGTSPASLAEPIGLERE